MSESILDMTGDSPSRVRDVEELDVTNGDESNSGVVLAVASDVVRAESEEEDEMK